VVNVTVTYTTRSDVDWIAVYRTAMQTTAVLAEAEDSAGLLFYSGRIANNAAGGTMTFIDNTAADSAEQIEIDNFTCPLFANTVFDGLYWWGFGNTIQTVIVQLNSTGAITLNPTAGYPSEWFTGRDTTPAGFNLSDNPNGNSISFVGITTGGYDGRGNFYIRITSPTTANVYNSAAMVSPTAIAATGATTAYLTSPLATLYRSKPNNPFSWGQTTVIISDGAETEVPALWAEKIGGGIGTAISLIPNERILKLDCEAPTKSYALDLNAAGEDTFLGTLRTLDEAMSVSSQNSQFPMREPTGQSVGTGFNAKSNQILASDAQSQIPIGTNVIRSLRDIDSSQADFFHGIFDFYTELNCWWANTAATDYTCDTLLYRHAATDTWGLAYQPGISASAMVFDGATGEQITIVGTSDGLVGQAFKKQTYRNWLQAVRVGTTAEYNGGTVVILTPVIATIDAAICDGEGLVLIVTTAPHGLSVGDMIALNNGTTIFRVTTVDDATTFEITLNVQGVPAGAYDAGTYIIEPQDLTWGAWVKEDASYVVRVSNVVIQLVNEGIASCTADLETCIEIESGEETALDQTTGQQVYSVFTGCNAAVIRRYFNGGNPERDKSIQETWVTMQNVDTATNKFFASYYYEYKTAQADSTQVVLTRDEISSGVPAIVYFNKTPLSGPNPSFGAEVYEAGYEGLEIFDLTLKLSES